jgi:hypothetical protein
MQRKLTVLEQRNPRPSLNVFLIGYGVVAGFQPDTRHDPTVFICQDDS